MPSPRTNLNRVRTLAWTIRALSRVRRQLRTGGLDAVKLPPSPGVPGLAPRSLGAALTCLRATCLERSLLRQAWLADRGHEVEVVIGVSRPSEGFSAHAWLDAEGDVAGEGYLEVSRRDARGGLRTP